MMEKHILFSKALSIGKERMESIHREVELAHMGVVEFLKYKKQQNSKHDYILIEGSEELDQIRSEFVLLKFRDAEISETNIKEFIQNMLDNGADIAYSDSSINQHPYLKSDVSIDILLQGIEEYDVLLMRTELYRILKLLFNNNELCSGTDYLLASYFITKRILHIEKTLYHTQLPITQIPQLAADYLDYVAYKNSNEKISIIIPTKDKVDLLDQCIQSILSKTTYQNYDIIIINNRSELTESITYFNKIRSDKIKIVDADIDFNWSKLNNIGIQNSDAEIYVFLNNDTMLIEPDWLQHIAGNCSRNDVGVVGGLLLYEDDTIQHAGVVVGLVDFADHLYKGERITIKNDCFYTPDIKRNVLAVTGACMAIAKKTIQKIGFFNEDFIICGSDVEICIRAYQHGLNNIYDPAIKLYHLESKSRDSYIPPIDFELSKKFYEPYRSKGDPFFHHSLDRKCTTPRLKGK